MLENLAQLKQIADIIAAQFGPDTEVVVHDFTDDPDHTIAYIINGHISGRKIGDGPSQSFLRYVNHQDNNNQKIRYISHTGDGKIIRSSTANFFNNDGSLDGALCINQDVTNLISLEKAFKGMSESGFFETSPLSSDNVNDIYGISVHRVLDGIISEGLSMIGTKPDKMNKDARIRLLKFLDERGVFLIQKSGQKVCDLLGISKFTLYNYLDEIREDTKY